MTATVESRRRTAPFGLGLSAVTNRNLLVDNHNTAHPWWMRRRGSYLLKPHAKSEEFDLGQLESAVEMGIGTGLA